jgi:hypothetical protein
MSTEPSLKQNSVVGNKAEDIASIQAWLKSQPLSSASSAKRNINSAPVYIGARQQTNAVEKFADEVRGNKIVADFTTELLKGLEVEARGLQAVVNIAEGEIMRRGVDTQVPTAFADTSKGGYLRVLNTIREATRALSGMVEMARQVNSQHALQKTMLNDVVSFVNSSVIVSEVTWPTELPEEVQRLVDNKPDDTFVTLT